MEQIHKSPKASAPAFRPLRDIEQSALIRAAEKRGWTWRRILDCLVFQHPDNAWDRIIINVRTMRWRELVAGGEGAGLVELAELIHGWSTENAVRRLAKLLRTEWWRRELIAMVEVAEHLHARGEQVGEARFFIQDTNDIITHDGVIRPEFMRKARSEFISNVLGFDRRINDLLDRTPVGASPPFYDAIGAALAQMRTMSR
jgi:hypothetical protein